MCKYSNQWIDDKLVTWDDNIIYNKIIMFSQRSMYNYGIGYI